MTKPIERVIYFRSKKNSPREIKTGDRVSIQEFKRLKKKNNRLGSVAWTKNCSSGHRPHDSYQEAQYCEVLKLKKRAGLIKDFRTQVTYELKVKNEKTGRYHRICGHRVDFEVERIDGKIECHEFKGFKSIEWQIKKNLFEAVFPEIPYLVKDERDLI